MKKLLAILLAAIMVIPMFAACKPKESGKHPENTPEPSEAQKTEEPNETSEPTDEPIVESTGEPEPLGTFVEGEDGWMVSTGIPVWENNPTEAQGKVVLGTSTEAAGDWAFAYDGMNGATDNMVVRMTHDCDTVITDMSGSYIINPRVVKAYKRVEDPDTKDLTYTWKINEDLVFSNGDPIKAEDFLAWSLFVGSPTGVAMNSTATGNSIPGGKEYLEGDVPYLKGLHLIDDYTFSVSALATGYDGSKLLPYYYEIAGMGAGAINIPYWFGPGWHVKDDGEGAYLVNDDPEKKFIEENIKEYFENAAFGQGGDQVCTGPYVLTQWDPASLTITLTANPNYNGDYQGRKPGIKEFIIVKTEDDTVIDWIKTGKIDLYSAIVSGKEAAACVSLIEDGTIQANSQKYDRAGYGYLAFTSDFGPTQFMEFRQAICYLLKRSEFVNTFCKGYGTLIHGPYATAFDVYQDSEDLFDEKLDTYDFNPDKAVELLKSIGFVYNEDGTDYVDGSGLVRYKEVTEEEAKYYDDYNKVVDGKVYMPAMINWASSENNEVSDLLATMLVNGEDAAKAGVKVVQSTMPFANLLGYMYRQDLYGVGGTDFTVPKFNMFNLATSYNAQVIDESYNWTSDPDFLAAGYNTDHLYDEELDKLSMDMVYGVEAGDYDTYLDMWQKYIIRWNMLVPRLPLYCNELVTIYPKTITNYQEYSFWGPERAILYADWVG